MLVQRFKLCYYQHSKGDNNMPDYILLEDMIDDMLDDVSYIKLNSHLIIDEEE